MALESSSVFEIENNRVFNVCSVSGTELRTSIFHGLILRLKINLNLSHYLISSFKYTTTPVFTSLRRVVTLLTFVYGKVIKEESKESKK